MVSMPMKKSDNPDHIKNETHGNQFWDFMPKEGKVSLLPANRKMPNLNLKVKAYWDHETGIVYGTPAGFDPKTGEINWRTAYVNGSREFNLATSNDREDLYLILHSQALKNGVHDKGYGTVIADDQEKEATRAVERAKKSVDAFEIIASLKDDELAKFGVLFGINSNQKPVIIMASLFEHAKKNPKDVVNKYKDPNREVSSLVQQAIMLGVFQETGSGVIHGSNNLGLRAHDAVEYLVKNPDLHSVVQQEVYGLTVNRDASQGKPKEKALSVSGRSMA